MTTTAPRRRFEILREVAAGGFGSVYVAKLVQPDGFSRVVAVKLLHPQWSENEEVASRMRDEARLLGLLRHRNIVDVLDLTRIDGRVAIIMEYLEAVDGKAVLKLAREADEPLPHAVALQICAQLSSALDAAYNKAPFEGHRPLRVIHRDIKPSNIMIDAHGVVKVLDFGVARADFDEREARTQGMAFGSFDYMPPERRFMEPGGETSDVYSVAALLFEFLVGDKIGKGKLKPAEHAAWVSARIDVARQHIKPGIAKDLAPLMERMLSFDAADRPKPGRVTTSFRRLARQAGDEPLDEWSERNIPPLLEEYREAKALEQPGPLAGMTVTEDAPATDSDEGLDDENTDEVVAAVGVKGASSTQSIADDDMTPPPAPRVQRSASGGQLHARSSAPPDVINGIGAAPVRGSTPAPGQPRTVGGIGALGVAGGTPVPVSRATSGTPAQIAPSDDRAPGTSVPSMPGPAKTEAASQSTMYLTKETRVTQGPTALNTFLYMTITVASWGLLLVGLMAIIGAVLLVAAKWRQRAGWPFVRWVW